MGQLDLDAIITHLPSICLGMIQGACFGTRQSAMDGHLHVDPCRHDADSTFHMGEALYAAP